jgi:hypothetical protein
MSSLRPDEVPVFYTKVQLAQIQLTEAIKYFLDENYIPCITLAGASEEILRGLLTSKGEVSITDASIKHIEIVKQETGLELMGGMTKNEIFKQWNKTRNILKHHDAHDAEGVELHPFNDAYMMIRRGLSNAKGLAIEIPNSQDFENWMIADALRID